MFCKSNASRLGSVKYCIVQTFVNSRILLILHSCIYVEQDNVILAAQAKIRLRRAIQVIKIGRHSVTIDDWGLRMKRLAIRSTL